jgi:prepilin-type N-terminal cleavage/methylation domain-containing protein
MQPKLKQRPWEKGLKHLWRRQRQLHPMPPQQSQGFTLIELLVAALIGVLVTSGLLYLVVELTQVNQIDTSRTETQRDMQQAMDYISQDLREAVFVYDGACLAGNNGGVALDNTTFATRCPGIVNHIPDTMLTTGGNQTRPVLAFWRLDAIPPALRTAANTGCTALAQTRPATATTDVFAGRAYCESGKTYTLVVYGIDTANPGGIWRGRSRLVRYTLNQFNAAGAPTPGFVDPTSSGSAQFQQWPYSRNALGAVVAPSAGQARPEGVKQILTDFLDRAEPDVALANANTVCAAPSQISPSDPRSAFYACIRGNTQAARDAGDPAERDANQEVLLVLTGNVAGRPGFNVAQTNRGRLAPLQTRVLTRGILDKDP